MWTTLTTESSSRRHFGYFCAIFRLIQLRKNTQLNARWFRMAKSTRNTQHRVHVKTMSQDEARQTFRPPRTRNSQSRYLATTFCSRRRWKLADTGVVDVQRRELGATTTRVFRTVASDRRPAARTPRTWRSTTSDWRRTTSPTPIRAAPAAPPTRPGRGWAPTA